MGKTCPNEVGDEDGEEEEGLGGVMGGLEFSFLPLKEEQDESALNRAGGLSKITKGDKLSPSRLGKKEEFSSIATGMLSSKSTSNSKSTEGD